MRWTITRIIYRSERLVYSQDGETKPDERCLQFFQFQQLSLSHVFNSNPGTDKINWVFYLEEGEKLMIESKFVSEDFACYDENGYITVHSGELPELDIFEYLEYNGNEHHTGYAYNVEITEPIEFEIAGPIYMDTIQVVVKIAEVEENNPDFAFLNQINFTNSVIISTYSENNEIVEIYSSIGDLVQTFTVSDQQTIELEGLAPGMYFFRADVHGQQLMGKYMQF